jgi:hypothetical protein
MLAPNFSSWEARLAAGKLGQILALVGLLLLVLSGLGGRRRLRSPQAATLRRWQRLGHLLGFVLIMIGLLVMWAEK